MFKVKIKSILLFMTVADRDNLEQHGLVFRSFIYLFDELAKRRSEGDSHFVIRASYLEIYNEKVIDLLNPGPKRSNLTVRLVYSSHKS